MIATQPQPLLTEAQAAAFLALKRRQLVLLVQRGEVPAVRLGKKLRFDPETIKSKCRYQP